LPKPSISVFFPCYNDSNTIGDLVVEAERQLQQLTDDYEIIVVNDGSTDASADVLRGLAGRIPRLTVITLEQNRGYGGALRSGFTAATKELVFYTDGDGQYDVRELPVLLMLLTDDTDFVNGIKMTRQDPAYRVHAGNIHQFCMRWLFWLPIHDVDCDFRLIRRGVFDRIELTRDNGLICVELVTKVEKSGAVVRYAPVHHYHRLHGKSQFFNLRRVAQVALGIGRLWYELIVRRRITISGPPEPRPGR